MEKKGGKKHKNTEKKNELSQSRDNKRISLVIEHEEGKLLIRDNIVIDLGERGGGAGGWD